ncbi:MAG: Uma2 family endonuclease [Bryobacteraceae bacterium]
MAIATGITIEDFETLPDALAHNRELVNGELVDVSGNLGGHNRLRAFLFAHLFMFARQHGLGEVQTEQEFQFGEDAHGPDVSFFGPEKAAMFEDRRVQRFVPDLAVEIAGVRDTFDSLTGKAVKYRRFGVQDVWVFDIKIRQAFRWSKQGDAILNENDNFASWLIPDFSIRIGDLFDRA